ncbi:MAG: IS21 family transposase [Planctomycetota bacterium]|jgi:transposase|nr:IS21 family transposase [Planctomycetota bacterium]
MYGMYRYKAVRQYVMVDGHSQRAAAAHFGIARETVAKMLDHSEPPGYRRSRAAAQPKLDPFKDIIDEILASDTAVRRKQRHTAQRIFERLRAEHGYSGGYTIVKDYVRAQKRRTKERFVPLTHDPGMAQVDFGEAVVRMRGVEVKAHIFAIELPYSNHVFYRAYPAENTEALLDGHVAAFTFFGGVPQRILYDNMSQIVQAIEANGNRVVTRNFARLASHHLFEERFARIAHGNDKGCIESGIKRVQRSMLTPIVDVGSWEELNTYLQDRCAARMGGHVHGKPGTIAERFVADQAALRDLPRVPFDPSVASTVRATSTGLARFKTNDYTIPMEHAYEQLTVKSSAWQVAFSLRETEVARHERCYDRECLIANPLHHLSILAEKPGALDQAAALRGWAVFARLAPFREQLRVHLGRNGDREFIAVLLLMTRYGIGIVERATVAAHRLGAYSCDAVQHLVLCDLEDRPPRLDLAAWPHLPQAEVATTQPHAYMALLEASA